MPFLGGVQMALAALCPMTLFFFRESPCSYYLLQTIQGWFHISTLVNSFPTQSHFLQTVTIRAY